MPERPILTPAQGAYLLLSRLNEFYFLSGGVDPLNLYRKLERQGEWRDVLQDSQKSQLLVDKVSRALKARGLADLAEGATVNFSYVISPFLTDREETILIMHFALAGGQINTLQEISSVLGISGTTINLSEQNVLRKLRLHSNMVAPEYRNPKN